jgi:5'-hydroxyaverantin dehydrogenase
MTTYLAFYYFRIPPTPSHSSLRSIILTSSLAGYTDFPWSAGYQSTKLGVRGIFKSLRGGTGKFGIRLNLIAPWFAQTPMTSGLVLKLDASGVPFATVDAVVDATLRCIVDETIQSKYQICFIMKQRANKWFRSGCRCHAAREF